MRGEFGDEGGRGGLRRGTTLRVRDTGNVAVESLPVDAGARHFIWDGWRFQPAIVRSLGVQNLVRLHIKGMGFIDVTPGQLVSAFPHHRHDGYSGADTEACRCRNLYVGFSYRPEDSAPTGHVTRSYRRPAVERVDELSVTDEVFGFMTVRDDTNPYAHSVTPYACAGGVVVRGFTDGGR